MRFFSDNAAAAHPEVMEAIAAANRLDTAYDGDAWSQPLDGAFSDLFETEVAALWVSTGTAANCLALAALCPPHGAIVCHRDAHIEIDECGAPGFFTHGAKLMLVDGPGAKLTPEPSPTLLRPGPRRRPPGPAAALSITNATEYGLVYTPAEIGGARRAAPRARPRLPHRRRALRQCRRLDRRRARRRRPGGPASTRCRFGFVKNGGLNAEALILFRPELADETLYRRKRAGHLLSKGRYLAAQILAMLEDDVWLAMPAPPTPRRRLAEAAGATGWSIRSRPMSCSSGSTADEAATLRGQGFDFYDWGPGEIRLVTSWDQDMRARSTQLAAAIAAL